MKAHSQAFKNNIVLFGKEINSKITYIIENVEYELSNEDLNSITPNFNSSILKSAMRGLKIDSNIEIPKDTIVHLEFGVKVREASGNDDGYDYINYGDYIVKDVEKQEDTNSYLIQCYDFMLKSMKDYEPMNITYPISIRNYINAICQHLGLQFKNINDTFANYDKIIQNELYLSYNSESQTWSSLDYTFRDVLDELAQVTGSTICIDIETNKLEVRYITLTEGKNKFDKENIEWYRNNSGNWGSHANNSNIRIKTQEFAIEGNKTYTISGYPNNVNFLQVKMYDINHNNLGNATKNNDTFTLVQNACYIFVLFGGENFTNETNELMKNANIQIEEGNIATEYVPFSQGDTIDEQFLKDVNVNFGEKFGPVNTIVLSRSAGADNVYYPAVLPEDPKEIKISDNQIMNGNDRADYLPDLYNVLNGLEYYTNDFSSTGICYYDICDRYAVKIDENIYSCVMFNDEVDITQGLEENVYTDLPEETNTDYTKADKDDRKINQTYIMVDKQNGVIESLAKRIVIVSKILNGVGQVQLENAHAGMLHKLSISGQISLLFPQSESNLYGYPLVPSDSLVPSNNLVPSSPVPYGNEILYPSSDLYSKSSILLIDDVEYKLDFDFLNYYSATVFDEFVYEDGECKIIRRVGIDSQGNKYALDNEIIEQRTPIELNVDTESIIKLKSFNNTIFNVEYLLENEYTNTFATQVEVHSQITQTNNKIEAAIEGVADENGKINGASILLAVNKDGSEAKLDADKIALEGYTTINKNFKIDLEGNMEVNNGKFNGLINAGSIEVKGYTEQDPYIRIGDMENDGGMHPYGTTIWDNGITVADYRDGNNPVIRTETSHNYAELNGGEVNAFAFNNVSLAEKKKDFELLESGLDILKNIDIYKYFYKDENQEKKHIGVVIGDKYKYSKEITTQDNKEIDLYSFISVCCKAIQEQQIEIENLKKEMEELKDGFSRISK